MLRRCLFGNSMKSNVRGSKLFRKYFSAFMIILVLCFTFLGSALLVFSMQYWTNERHAQLLSNTYLAAQEVSYIYDGIYVRGDDSARQRALAQVLAFHAEAIDEAQFFLFDTQGRVVACPHAVHETLLPSPVRCEVHGAWRLPSASIDGALRGRYTFVGNPGGGFGAGMLIAANPFTLYGEVAGFVLAAQPFRAGLIEYLGGILQLFLSSGLVVMLLAFIAVYVISRRLVRPLNDMVSATKHYAKGDFRYRVSAPESDELHLLAQSFNAMAINLATLEASRRSFVANVSHELKTPMTSIGGFIDGMLDGTIAPEDHAKYLQLVSGEVKRLARLVTGMLNLSKIEAGELPMKRTRFDASELLFKTLLSFEKMIATKEIELEGLDELAPMPIHGDKDLLTQVLYNLIDNAVKFTPPGGKIQVRAWQDRTANAIALRNFGTGIPAEELPQVFERFYKLDKSRSYDTKGAGLGLYLAKTIVAMHGGTIRAESDGATWTEFTVELPMD